MFQVVRFPNDACDSDDNSKNGTCYTKEECSERGGTESGTCASGFGVCCINTIHCGDTTKENTTYFESQDVKDGDCRVKVCKSEEGICQIRLDFITFSILGPSTDTATIAKELNGIQSESGTQEVNARTQCNDDSFSVSSPGNPAPPVICGYNTGEHMYVDASDACLTMNFHLGESGSTFQRTWNVRVTQFKCDYENLAPSGCTQYYFNPEGDEGIVTTYNYNNGQGMHLAQQRQTICIRREENKNTITWSAAMDTDFQLTGDTGAAGASVPSASSKCCGYGKAGDDATGYDCAMIPGGIANDPASPPNTVNWEEFCGGKLDTTRTITSTFLPFMIIFNSDNFEAGQANNKVEFSKGFKLSYKLS